MKIPAMIFRERHFLGIYVMYIVSRVNARKHKIKVVPCN
ncbi:conserved hypothetical protein [Ligilactobacillus salivarius cp400]|uniref:Uncharacterized protein n=1 Tax=Ligilactobacillus salivarius cp400 TaxID=1273133 RepID=V6DJ73_9LACO|nr:conserved hypothetical protein [Ligilactobacillus salivarius cp400]